MTVGTLFAWIARRRVASGEGDGHGRRGDNDGGNIAVVVIAFIVTETRYNCTIFAG